VTSDSLSSGVQAIVLVADDDVAVRRSECEILEIFGYHVLAAADGDEALRQLGEHTVDAVVLDIKMPQRDGLSVVRDMDPTPPPPGVVLVTAYDVSADDRRTLGGRVRRVLQKPVSPASLVEAVADAVTAGRNGE